MARRAKRRNGKTEDDTGVSALRGNGYDSEKVQSFANRIENVQIDIDRIMADAKVECEPHRQDIKEIKKEAKESGIPAREFSAILSKRRALKRAESFRERLSEEQQDNFDQLESALGMFSDSPLGKAALSKAKGNGARAGAAAR